MKQVLKQITDAPAFHRFVLGVIFFAGVLVGLETSPEMVERHGSLFNFLERLILGIFVVEIAIKMGAHGARFWRFFQDPWNVFDFVIVAICFIPMHGQFAAVLRMVRILRVLRLVSGIPRLQLLVGALLKSVPSMGYVGILLAILFYMYGVMGTFLFREYDPVHFGSLHSSMISLFRTVTMEDWTDLMYTQMYGPDYVEGQTIEVSYTPMALVSVIFFISFILIGTMIMLNLFIGVIMNSMNEVQKEAELAERNRHRRELGHVTVADDLKLIERQIDQLKESLHTVLHRVEKEPEKPPALEPGKPPGLLEAPAEG